MNKSLVAFPSTIFTKYFSNFLRTRDPSRSLSHELCFVIRSSSSQTAATHWTINAVHSRVTDKELNLRHLPAHGILGMFMNEVLLHFDLQLGGSAHVFNKEEKSSLGGLPARRSGCSRFCTHRSSALTSSRLRSHIVPLALAVVKSTANPSRSPNLVEHDANFDGLSIAVVSHAFNSFESMHNSMTSS